MILTPLEGDQLAAALALFAATLEDVLSRAVFARIAVAEHAARAAHDDAAAHHRAALALAGRFGMALIAGSPTEGFGWDGDALRTDTEAYVLLHEIAHFQLAAPARRGVIDFGLGPGPETGARDAAEAARKLWGLAAESEEAMASLLGILWEVELGQPALASFLDQNWLEGAGRRSAAGHFEAMLAKLREGGFIDANRRPTRQMRRDAD